MTNDSFTQLLNENLEMNQNKPNLDDSSEDLDLTGEQDYRIDFNHFSKNQQEQEFKNTFAFTNQNSHTHHLRFNKIPKNEDHIDYKLENSFNGSLNVNKEFIDYPTLNNSNIKKEFIDNPKEFLEYPKEFIEYPTLDNSSMGKEFIEYPTLDNSSMGKEFIEYPTLDNSSMGKEFIEYPTLDLSLSNSFTKSQLNNLLYEFVKEYDINENSIYHAEFLMYLLKDKISKNDNNNQIHIWNSTFDFFVKNGKYDKFLVKLLFPNYKIHTKRYILPSTEESISKESTNLSIQKEKFDKIYLDSLPIEQIKSDFNLNHSLRRKSFVKNMNVYLLRDEFTQIFSDSMFQKIFKIFNTSKFII